MRSSRSVPSRKNLAILAFLITALALSLSSRASVAHSGPSLKSTATNSCIGTTNVCFYIETVDPKPGENNYITGVNNADNIVGAYSVDNSTFNSVWESPKPGSSTYPQSGFVLENDSNNYQSTFLQGLDNTTDVTTAHQVGYARNICPTCNSVGVVYNKGVWTVVQDPNNGTCPANTEVLAMENPQQGVGSYLKPMSNGTCELQAFEFYPKTGSSGAFTYVDFSPPPPTSTESIVSSTANGINELGDVVGTETYGSPPRQAAWFYSELQYHTFTNNGDNTFGRGIDFTDRVVGYYVDSSGTHGFLVTNPVSPTFITLDYNPHQIAQPYTVVNSITIKTNSTDYDAISGWYFDGSIYHGFVGTCTTTCPNVPRLKGHAKPVRPLTR